MLVGKIAGEEALYFVIERSPEDRVFCSLNEARLIVEATQSISDILRQLSGLKGKKGSA
jgi:hypothetical protein